MCDELGDIEYMRAYIQDKSSPPCSINDPTTGCNEKEIGFIEKWNKMDGEAVVKELNRLDSMRNAKLTEDLQKWQNQRIRLLQQFQKKLEPASEGPKEL